VLSGRRLYGEPIIRPEESYGLRFVVECDLENLMNKEALAHWGAVAPKKEGRISFNCDTFYCFRRGRGL
jgi:hypothetical protein